MLDRPELFHVFDSGKPCDKGFEHCCCHLKIQLQEGVGVPTVPEMETAEDQRSDRRRDRERKREQKRESEKANGKQAVRPHHAQKDVAIELLFSNEDLVIVDKPPHIETEKIIEGLQAEADLEGLGRKVVSCSRLDKNTSGCLLVPWHAEACKLLTVEFAEHRVAKVYWALAWGRAPAEGEVTAKLFLVENHTKYRVYVSPKGKPATTRFRTLATYLAPDDTSGGMASAQGVVTLLECYPVTGRTHQIRAHLEHIGHRIVGDTKYGKVHGIRDLAWCPRLFLHCRHTSGNYGPLPGRPFQAESPLRPDLAAVIAKLAMAPAR